MAVSDVKLVCWMCGQAFAPADMTPVEMPQVPIELVLTQGGVSRIVPPPGPQPTCPNCLPKAQAIKQYASKPAV